VLLETLVRITKSGKYYMSTKLRRLKLRDLTKSSVSISIDHSILDLDFHSKELLNATVPTTFG
jgi:hypothetical protein